MKRTIIASILGMAASVVTTYGQITIFFDTYYGNQGLPGEESAGEVTWTTITYLAPVGKAGQVVTDAERFKADLLWQVGTVTGDLGLAVPTSTFPPGWGYPPGSGGWIEGGIVSFDNAYQTGQPFNLTINVWQGASYANASARGTETWTEPGVVSGDAPLPFNNMPQVPIYVSIPEPTTFALLGLGAAAVLMFRRRQ